MPASPPARFGLLLYLTGLVEPRVRDDGLDSHPFLLRATLGMLKLVLVLVTFRRRERTYGGARLGTDRRLQLSRGSQPGFHIPAFNDRQYLAGRW